MTLDEALSKIWRLENEIYGLRTALASEEERRRRYELEVSRAARERLASQLELLRYRNGHVDSYDPGFSTWC